MIFTLLRWFPQVATVRLFGGEGNKLVTLHRHAIPHNEGSIDSL